MIPFPDALISRLEGTLLNSTPLTAMMPVLLGTVTAYDVPMLFPFVNLTPCVAAVVFGLLDDERIHRLYLFYAFQSLITHVDIHSILVNLYFIDTNIAKTSCCIETMLQTHCVIEYIPFPPGICVDVYDCCCSQIHNLQGFSYSCAGISNFWLPAEFC